MSRLKSKWAWRLLIPACWNSEYWALVKGSYIVQDVDRDTSTCISFISQVIIVKSLRYPKGDLVCLSVSIHVRALIVLLLQLRVSVSLQIWQMVRQNVLQMLANGGPVRFEDQEKQFQTFLVYDQ